MKESKTIYNFSAGPCCLPKEVLKIAHEEMYDWHGSGISVMEMSHRSKWFEEIIKKTEEDLRKLMSIPDNFKVLFFQGGASLQFCGIPMNLLKDNKRANYLVTGSWGKHAIEEARKYGEITEVIEPMEDYTGCPDFSEWKIDPEAKYFHFCDNETIYGVEFNNFPYDKLEDQLIVCDMSSNFGSRKVDWSRYGLVYAGSHKNLGPSGVCVIVVREDLIGHQMDITPEMTSYKAQAEAQGQCYNTPCCWSNYV